MSDNAQEHHTGPVKTPGQLAWLSFFSFVAPVFIIIGLVMYVTAGDKPSAGADNTELAVAKRIQRVGTVEIRMPTARCVKVQRCTQRSVLHATRQVQLAHLYLAIWVLGLRV